VEDDYLVGLTTSYLRIHPAPSRPEQTARDAARIRALLHGGVTPGSLAQEKIRLNGSIDSALERAVPSSAEGAVLLRRWKDFRSAMLQLAYALGRVSGVPVVRDSTPPEA
jgi:hypothetical protein